MKLVMEVTGERVCKQPWDLEESHKKFFPNIVSFVFPKVSGVDAVNNFLEKIQFSSDL